ncbi:MAG: hypothetical protein ING08_01735 [Roseomonas sp.]|nr:hypothetical protein [Roseomonas sp.]MCA3378944.1 hypothetical protein [Roseomonas sp.]
MSNLRIGIDLSHAERNAIALREMLIALRTNYALGPYEYCKEVSIAPTMLPYSHPVIRLNTALVTETALLACYIHEQMHWYVTWYSHTFNYPHRRFEPICMPRAIS